MAKASARDRYFAVWTTAWGPMGAVAGDAGLRRVVLPHYNRDDLLALLGWEHPSAVENAAAFEELISLSRRYFNAEPVDFDAVGCDLPSAGSFAGAVYRACRRVRYGRTVSYGDLARDMSRPDAARAVAAAMTKNPMPLVVPCHRVIYASGRAGGFSTAAGPAMKLRMLQMEARSRGPQTAK